MSKNLKVIIIAGPNGAGKTTFAREFLPNEGDCPIFVNADLIAAGLSPFDPETVAVKAGRIMLQEIQQHFSNRNNFAFETTLAGRGYLRYIKMWQTAGYKVKLIFLKLSSPQEAIARVALRVSQGGHNIPENVISRRYKAGLSNFLELYTPIVDSWTLYDSSGPTPEILDWGKNK